MKQLKDILEYRRPHNSIGEELFVQNYLSHATPYLDDNKEVLAYVIDVSDINAVVPPVLWCCHIDTVHDSKNIAPRQTIIHDEQIDMMFCLKNATDCLGSDDGAGIWLLLEMINAGVPGSYIFHRGEEIGGVGSLGMADHHEEWLKRFKWAIAFDRRSDCSVITQQFGGRCCSDIFAEAFGNIIKKASEITIELHPDPTGSFTDTANYIHLIPECTNISVGYTKQHTSDEDLDCLYLQNLRNALITAFYTAIDLPVIRVVTDKYKKFDYGYDFPFTRNNPYDTYDTYDTTIGLDLDMYMDAEEILKMSKSDLEEAVFRTDADDLADLIITLADSVITLREMVTNKEVMGVDGRVYTPLGDPRMDDTERWERHHY